MTAGDAEGTRGGRAAGRARGAAGGPVRWETVLDAVVVYARGALCTRVARGVLPADGDGRVLLTGLPRCLDRGSVRARVAGGSGARVTGVRVRLDAEVEETEPSDEPRRQVEKLRERCAAVRARRDRLLGRVRELAEVRPVPPERGHEDPPRRTAGDAWLRFAEFVDERLTALHRRLAAEEAELRRVEHELALAEDRLQRASTAGRAVPAGHTVGAEVTVEGGAGELHVEVEYTVPGAVWVPAYRLAYRQGDDSGTLVLRASVAQHTGEDWTGVRLALATADLDRRAELPRLPALRIGRRTPAPAPVGWREPPTGLDDLFAGYDAAGAAPRAPRPAGPAAGGIRADAPDTPRPEAGVSSGAVHGAGGEPPRPVAPAPPPPAVGAPPAPVPAAPAGTYGAAPGAGFTAPAAAPQAMPAAPHGAAPGDATRAGGALLSGPRGPLADPASPEPGTVRPGADELDYPDLVLAGPGDSPFRRGKLFPSAADDPAAEAGRRRAESVASLPLPGHAVRPRESAGSFDHRYDAVARADIPSDGTWHTVTVTRVPVGLRTEYLCVPLREERVYRTLVLSNPTRQALLAGPVEVVADDDHLLTAALPTLAPGGERRMGLGPVEDVEVARRTVLHESTAGLRNNVTVLEHRVRVELVNRLGRDVTVEVRERVPVADDADVRIEEHADWSVPAPDGPEPLPPGTRLWRVPLPAGGSAEREGRYEIRIPSAKALVGGNRRS